MITVKFQLFLFDPKAEKQDMLLAVDPPFSTPTAIDAIIKTVKFEGKEPLIAIGLQDKIDELLKQAERLDTTEWLALELPERMEKLKALIAELGLDCRMKMKEEDDQQVLGSAEEVTAASKFPYPVDLPPGNRSIWNSVRYQPDFKTGWELLKRAGKHKDPVVATAVYRNFYEKYAEKMQKIPWNNVTKTQISDQRAKLKGFIEQGEEYAQKVVTDLQNHLLHAGLIHKVRAQKFGGICRHPDSNHYLLVHKIPWVYKPEQGHSWLQIASFIKREFGQHHAFKEGRNKLSTLLNLKGTVPVEIEILRRGDKEKLYVIEVNINHYLTENQAAVLTQETEHDRIDKKMGKYCNLWYSKGKFPRIDEEDF